MDVTGCTLEEIVDATEYYQSQANVMAAQAGRDAQGYLSFEDFDTLASRAGMGFQYLTYQRYYPVFAGSTLPVKKLGWADMYSAMATNLADTINDAYLKASGETAGVASYGEVCDLLVNWHIQEVVLPALVVVEERFDPYDETQVDLSGIVNAKEQY